MTSERKNNPYWMGLITLFPEMFQAITDFGVVGRAIKNGLVTTHCVNPREFTSDRHKTVDDRPYGGGPGMLMMVQPLVDAIQAAKEKASKDGLTPKVVYLSPQGQLLDQNRVQEFVSEPGLILLSGRYEGIDERLIEHHVDAEISIGDYVLSGGELPAMVLMDAVIRQLPGVLGHSQSAQLDSFSNGLLDHPHFTRPEVYAGKKVPQVLLSGNHEKIARWRLQQSLGRTYERRPDLLAKRSLGSEEQQLLEEYLNTLNQSDSESK